MNDDSIIRISVPKADGPPKRLGRGLGALLGETRREEPLVAQRSGGGAAGGTGLALG